LGQQRDHQARQIPARHRDDLLAEAVTVLADRDGAAVANQQLVDWTAGNIQQITLTANCTGTSTFVAPSGPAMLRLLVKQDATGSRTISWPAGVKWSGGAPTLTTTANAVDHFDLTYDGTSYYVRTTLNMV